MVRSAPAMLWRLWAFLATAPLGGLGVLAWPNPIGPVEAIACVIVAGLLGVALASLSARRGDDAPDRIAHVARGASAGLLAVPMTFAALLRFGPPPGVWLGIASTLLVLALWQASRTRGPGPGPLATGLAAGSTLLGGVLIVLAVAIGHALLPAEAALGDDELRDAVLDVDSRVPLLPSPACAPKVAGYAVLAEHGAAPRLGSDGETVWYEAKADGGRIQVFRKPPDAPPECWTCDEPGNNRRPAPHPFASSVLFDTDRFATPLRPNDTEVMVSRVRKPGQRRHPARRLTHRAGPDDHAFYDPSGAGFVWSSGTSGRFEVLRAAVQSGHGGLVLGRPLRLAAARVSWVVPLGWSRDARTLVVARGQPLAPLVGERSDPGTGTRGDFGRGLLPGSVSFSGDGRTVVAAETRAVGAARVVPALFGNALARRPGGFTPTGEGTEVRIGDVTREPSAVALGEIADWGWPTGIALAPDAASFVLGQRRDDGERILRVELDCDR